MTILPESWPVYELLCIMGVLLTFTAAVVVVMIGSWPLSVVPFALLGFFVYAYLIRESV